MTLKLLSCLRLYPSIMMEGTPRVIRKNALNAGFRKPNTVLKHVNSRT